MALGLGLLLAGAILSSAATGARLINQKRQASKQKKLAKRTAEFQYNVDLQNIRKMKEEGQRFLGRQRVGVALSGAGSGGSVEKAIRESRRNLKQDLTEARLFAKRRRELAISGANVEYEANRPHAWDFLNVGASFATDIAGALPGGGITGSRQVIQRHNRYLIGHTQQAVPGSGMWGL